MTPRAQRMAELRAIIEEAKAEIQAIKADEQIEKSDDAQAEANAIPEDMHEMPDGSLMANADMKGDAMSFAKAAGNNRGLEGNRDADGNLMTEKGSAMNFAKAAATLPDDADVEYEDIQQFTDDGVVIPISGYPIPVGENVPKSMKGDAMNFAKAAGKKTVNEESELEGSVGFPTYDKNETTDETSEAMRRRSNDPDELRASSEEDSTPERTMGMIQDEGGTSSVNEKDDFWKTQEGYDKAIQMYGDVPAWIKEPTMIFNTDTQEYEKIKEEDKEQYQDMGISDANKRLFG